MRYLLNIIYLSLIGLAAPVIAWRAWRHGKYREGWREKLWGHVPRLDPHPQRVWFHAVSVGEVNLLPGVIASLRLAQPQLDIVVSTTTQTGMQLARQHFGHAAVFYCPLDFTWSVNRALDHIKPTMLVLAELELWPNLIIQAKERSVSVAVINARLSDKSFRGYRKLRRLIRPMLRSLCFVGAQDPTTAERFATLGVPHNRIQVTGSIKFDGAPTDRGHREIARLRSLGGIAPQHRVMLAGSTIEPEETIVLEIYKKLQANYSQLRLIVVPRHPERFETVANQIDAAGLRCRRRSAMHAGEAIVVLHGPPIRKRGTIEGARLIDSAPTLLRAAGLPVPETLEGRGLEVF